MKNKIKIVKIVFTFISVIVLLVGVFFSFLVAHLDDAPGFVLFGSTIALIISSFIYALGEIIINLREINKKLK